jgi:hypothetical protein
MKLKVDPYTLTPEPELNSNGIRKRWPGELV